MIGVYVIFCILDIVDLIVEGSFFLGVGIVVVSIINGYYLLIVCFLGFLGGVVVGFVFGLFYIKLKIFVFFVGIIIMIGLYFVIFCVMGVLNIFLLG